MRKKGQSLKLQQEIGMMFIRLSEIIINQRQYCVCKAYLLFYFHQLEYLYRSHRACVGNGLSGLIPS